MVQNVFGVHGLVMDLELNEIRWSRGVLRHTQVISVLEQCEGCGSFSLWSFHDLSSYASLLDAWNLGADRHGRTQCMLCQ